MSSRSDRRRMPRIASRFPARYRLIPCDAAGYADGSVEDLSPEGARFTCAGAIRPRAGLLFEMLIPDAPPVRSFARTAWVKESAGRPGFEVGARFVDQSTAARLAIARHLRQGTVATRP